MSDQELSLIIEYRRALHKIPEIDKDLYKTNEYVTEVLRHLNCTLIPVAKTGVCAWFDRKKPSTAAFRCDMDALPIQEANTFEYVSTFPGKMHACGHDGHMALLLTFAQYVDAQKELPCNVLLIFQPAEETNGGAEEVAQSGVLEKYHVTRLFGLHIWPDLEKGVLSSRPGAMMAQSSEISFHIYGKSAHATTPEKAIDALHIGCCYVADLYEMREKEIPKTERAILKIGRFDSGTVRNAIASHTECLGTMRAFRPDVFSLMERRMQEIAKEYEKRFGCRFEFIQKKGFPQVNNDIKLYESILPALQKMPYQELAQPTLASEDFSFYGLRVPTVFFFLGLGEGMALHNNLFNFDEAVLLRGLALYKELLQCDG